MQGFNMGRYHAPASLDLSLAVPGKRGRDAKGPKALPTVRFEMPFAIWCNTCPSSSTSCLIGQGVRFNAQKTRIGNYYSTPIWQFRMKHTACGGWIEIRTDPEHSEYSVTDGARKRDIGSDESVAERIGGVLVGDAAEQAKRRQDAFAAFESKKADNEMVKGQARRLEVLQSLKQRDWGDVDAANQRLRNTFRAERNFRQKEAAAAERLKDSMGLAIDVVEEDEGDQRRAALVDFGPFENPDGMKAVTKPFFGQTTSHSGTNVAKSQPDMLLRNLRHQLVGNTRAAAHPFSDRISEEKPLSTKRKRQGLANESHSALALTGRPIPVLVDYDSD